ncbi:DUF5011 domain-containing protein [Vibrio sp.]|nr:DUF5011 domain-containing protein [Vibrio sp.]
MKLKLISAAIAAMVTGQALANGQEMVNPEGNLLVGYWHNWEGGAGYKGGTSKALTLQEIDSRYNVVMVSFMKTYDGDDFPTFKLDPETGMSESEFKDQIAELNRQGRAVMISLGGADAHVNIHTSDVQRLADEIIRLTDEYGFDGLDIDLEQTAITAADNSSAIPNALKLVKDHYRTQGKNFMIAMAPEFPYLTNGNAKYHPYINNLEGYYDFIAPQFYNQGGDGVSCPDLGLGWVAQNNDALKKEFIYCIADQVANGKGFIQIPHHKLVFGIPSNIDAAATGYVQRPQDLYDAFDMMEAQGQPLRGVMTWSINWDQVASNANGQRYASEFVNTYGPFIHSQNPPKPENGKPIISGVTDTRIKHGSNFDPMANVSATDSEDGNVTQDVTVEGFVDTNTLGNYTLTYRVIDSDGNETAEARNVEVYSVKPVIEGISDVSILLDSDFDPMLGVSAQDEEDGDLTSQVTVNGQVNTSQFGLNTLTYQVTDSAGQTTTEYRVVEVTDGSNCPAPWSADNTYSVAGEQVSHNGKTFENKWWTQGDEPNESESYGVWLKISDTSCIGGGDQSFEASFESLENSYAIAQGSVTFMINAVVPESASTVVKIDAPDSSEYAETFALVAGDNTLSITMPNAVKGNYSLNFATTSGEKSDTDSLMLYVNEEGNTTEPSDYPAYQAGTAYEAGDRVVAVDGNAYECKPWPYSGWCSSASYEPAVSDYWGDAWIRL